jgi:predicted amidohydrolase YtcJ
MSFAATTVRGAPTLIEHVSGYTLAANELQTFRAMVFDAGKVVATGDAKDLRKRFPAAQIIDGNGGCLPGLIDVHGHVFALGFVTVRIQLWDTQSLAEAQQRIRVYATANPNRNWLQGSGWNQVKWQLGRFPYASELDAVVADKPVVLSRVDGHAKWLNTKATQAAGVTRDTPDPSGGRIERDLPGSPLPVGTSTRSNPAVTPSFFRTTQK